MNNDIRQAAQRYRAAYMALLTGPAADIETNGERMRGAWRTLCSLAGGSVAAAAVMTQLREQRKGA